MLHGHVNQLAPHLQAVFIAALQFHHVATRPLGEGFVFVIVFLRRAVEFFQISQIHVTGVFVLYFFQIGNQHAELCTPVANVVSADHFMAEEFIGAHSRVADNGGADVANVHFFRHVWRRIVDDDSLGFNRCDAQFFIVQGAVYMRSNKSRIQEDIDETRPGDFDFIRDAAQV
ncbi:hypothetical protein SRABI106_03850 [Rahnella aquatilis]|nr:hypothetical protein SRABI106_03850 [Rahnella aquatilis]